MTEYWEARYKTCRAAFLATQRLHRTNQKHLNKDRQRIIQICKDSIDRICPVGKKMWSMLNNEEKLAIRSFETILNLLGVSGYGSAKGGNDVLV